MECGWIKEQLAEIDRQEGYPSAKSASDFLTSILREKDSYSSISERPIGDGSGAGNLLTDGGAGDGLGIGNGLDSVNLDFGLEIDENSIGGVTVFRNYS
jgi:hypothetical protein